MRIKDIGVKGITGCALLAFVLTVIFIFDARAESESTIRYYNSFGVESSSSSTTEPTSSEIYDSISSSSNTAPKSKSSAASKSPAVTQPKFIPPPKNEVIKEESETSEGIDLSEYTEEELVNILAIIESSIDQRSSSSSYEPPEYIPEEEVTSENIPESPSQDEPEIEEEYEEYTGIVNINTASIELLCSLDGIGEVTAAKIIDFRNSTGGFQSIDEIMLVSGIGQGKFSAIRDRITV